MNLKSLVKNFNALGWRAAMATFSANVRLYGWRATSRKIVRRLSISDNFYREYAKAFVRPGMEAVDKSAKLFSTPRIFIVGALDLPQCKKYRVLQKVEYFESIGWACGYSHFLDVPRVIGNIQISTALIFYRVPAIPLLHDYLKEAKRLGVATFYDIDDPIFNCEVYSENSNLTHLEASERIHLLGETAQYRKAMHEVDALILSTRYLQSLAAKDFGKPAFLWRNLADSSTLSMLSGARKTKNDSNPEHIVIGYASGSRAHDEDFKIVSEALARVLGHCENVSLKVLGYVIVPDELKAFESRIESQPFSGYLQYLQALGKSDINIVPLTSGRFNECKSAIRYIEASLCEVPTVASSVGQFSEIINDGEDGYLAQSAEDWIAKLMALIEDGQMRRTMAARAREKVMTEHTLTSAGAVDQETINQFLLSYE